MLHDSTQQVLRFCRKIAKKCDLNAFLSIGLILAFSLSFFQHVLLASTLLVCVYGRVFTYLRPLDLQQSANFFHPKITYDLHHHIPEDEHVDYYVSVLTY